jgi:transcriptional regulator with XRE-family HTH domain
MVTEFGKRLRQAREYAKLTQEEAVEKTGISQSTITTAETKGKGSTYTAQFADEYGVSAILIAIGKGEMVIKAEVREPVNAAQTITITVPPEFAQMCKDICKMLATLPDDLIVRNEVMTEIIKVISKARESPRGEQDVLKLPESKSNAA